MDLLSIALVVMTALSWSFSQILGKFVVRDMNSTIYNTLRLIMAMIVFTPVALLNGLRIPWNWAAGAAVLDGAFGLALGLLIFFYCMKRTPAHKVVTVGNASPVWVLILALMVLGESLTVLLPISLAFVMVGSFLLVQRKQVGDTEDWGPAVPLTMFVAFLYGADLVLRKVAVNLGMDIISFIWLSIVTAASILIVASLITQSWVGQRFTRKNMSFVFGASMLGHIVGTIVFMLALQMETVISLVPFASLTIPFGFLMSIYLVRERPKLKSTIGMGLVFFGVMLAAI
ncbi:MAG: DMT family transporter [Methanobacteriota archaeon]